MTTPQLERLTAHCERLRLHRVAADLTTLLEQAAKRELSYADFLDEMLGGRWRPSRTDTGRYAW
jgi:hypothetical protein